MGVFGLLGEKLSHSFSPQIHAKLARYEYKLFEVAPGEVEAFLSGGGFNGLNVTIPYKKTVMAYCAALSDTAEKIGSVNTVLRRLDGSLYGDNTDYYGFLYMLKKTGVSVGGKKAVVLGSGGASLTVRTVLGELGTGEVVVVSRSGENNYENLEKHANAAIVVNTTPVGMYPETGVSPVCVDTFTKCEAVLDLIYNPAKTEILLQAEDAGIPCAGGLFMLTAQAKRAAEIFTGTKIADEKIDKITIDISRKTKNIALIGMPGSGKSTVGKRLAQMTGREFVDTDTLVVKNAGKSIERIFAEDGEGEFRRIETLALDEASKRSGCVIATGGGIVKRAENRRLLRRNSVIVYLDRPLGELSTQGRPLSVKNGVQSLYAERNMLYNDWSEFKVYAVKGINETADAVRKVLAI